MKDKQIIMFVCGRLPVLSLDLFFLCYASFELVNEALLG